MSVHSPRISTVQGGRLTPIVIDVTDLLRVLPASVADLVLSSGVRAFARP